MSIERLNKAASAAGFAMATPDDDAAEIETPIEDEMPAESRALVLATPASRILHGDTLAALSAWAKNVWPTLGWRQPA
ncbi:MAG: hypothetical protein AB7E81_06125 [Hyphomicrobiaceae bacterium]